MSPTFHDNNFFLFFSLPEPYEGECGSPLRSNGLTVEHTHSANYTWAFAQCPLEDECTNGNHECKENEFCQDREIGFECLCKPGYERIEGYVEFKNEIHLCSVNIQ